MADPIRLQVLKALCAHLATINPTTVDSEGNALYGVYDLRGKVWRGRLIFGEEIGKTALTIAESPRADFGVRAGENELVRNEQWQLLLQGFAPEDPSNENPIDSQYELCGHVERCLQRIMVVNPNTGNARYPAEYRLGGLISGLVISPPVVRPPSQEITNKAFFYIQLGVGLVTDGRSA